MVAVAAIVLHLRIPNCQSLKEKRGNIKPILERVNRHLGLSASEIDLLDHWQETIIACSIVSNSQTHNQQVLQKVPGFIQTNFTDIDVVDQEIIIF